MVDRNEITQDRIEATSRKLIQSPYSIRLDGSSYLTVAGNDAYQVDVSDSFVLVVGLSILNPTPNTTIAGFSGAANDRNWELFVDASGFLSFRLCSGVANQVFASTYKVQHKKPIEIAVQSLTTGSNTQVIILVNGRIFHNSTVAIVPEFTTKTLNIGCLDGASQFVAAWFRKFGIYSGNVSDTDEFRAMYLSGSDPDDSYETTKVVSINVSSNSPTETDSTEISDNAGSNAVTLVTAQTHPWVFGNASLARRRVVSELAYLDNLTYSVRFKPPQNQYAEIAAHSSFIADSQDELTVLAWVIPRANSMGINAGQTVAGFNGATTNRNWELRVSRPNNSAVFIVTDGSDSDQLRHTVPMRTGELTLVGGVFKADETLGIIVNDNIQRTIPDVNLVMASKNLNLGNIGGASGLSKFYGQIAYFLVLNKALTDDEIVTFYKTGTIHSSYDKAIELLFTNGAGTTVSDTSGNTNHATLNGGANWVLKHPSTRRDEV